MDKWFDTVQDADGNAIAGAVVTVRIRASGVMANLFADDEATAITNPITTSDDGRIEFCAADNTYDLTIVYGGVTITMEHVVLGVTSSGGGGLLTDGDKTDITVSAAGATWTIDPLAVTSGKIASNAVTSGKLATDAVTTAKILDANVTTAKIADNAVTLAKLATMPAHTVLRNLTASAAVPTAATLAQDAAETADRQGEALTNFRAAVVVDTGTALTLSATHRGVLLTMNNASAIVLTLPNNLEVGYSVTVVQLGAGAITFTPAASATRINRQSHTKSAGQYSMCTLVVTANAGGAAAQWALGGDTAT